MDNDTDPNTLDANPPAEGSSTPADANTPAAPSAANDAKPSEAPKDFAELAIAELEKQHGKLGTDSSPTAPDQKEPVVPEGDINKSNATDEKPKGDSAPAKPVDFSDLPFHKHPRFQELLKERDELKTTTEAAQPQVQRLAVIEGYRQSHKISDDQFKDGMEIMALVNTNPEEALKRLEPLYNRLQEFKGQILPEDLKKEVDDGSLPLARAQEIASLRRKGEFTSHQAKATAEDQRIQVLVNAMNSWEATARRTDADFERKAQAVRDRFVALSASNNWSNPNDAVALMQRAYDEVNKWLVTITPKPKPVKAPPANGMSHRAKREFKSWDEAEDMLVDQYTNGRR